MLVTTHPPTHHVQSGDFPKPWMNCWKEYIINIRASYSIKSGRAMGMLWGGENHIHCPSFPPSGLPPYILHHLDAHDDDGDDYDVPRISYTNIYCHYNVVQTLHILSCS